jgi:hypothetical protein
MEYHSIPLLVKGEPTSGEACKGLIEIRGSILSLQLCEGSWVFMSSHLELEIEARGVIALLCVVFLPSFEVGDLSLPFQSGKPWLTVSWNEGSCILSLLNSFSPSFSASGCSCPSSWNVLLLLVSFLNYCCWTTSTANATSRVCRRCWSKSHSPYSRILLLRLSGHVSYSWSLFSHCSRGTCGCKYWPPRGFRIRVSSLTTLL